MNPQIIAFALRVVLLFVCALEWAQVVRGGREDLVSIVILAGASLYLIGHIVARTRTHQHENAESVATPPKEHLESVTISAKRALILKTVKERGWRGVVNSFAISKSVDGLERLVQELETIMSDAERFGIQHEVSRLIRDGSIVYARKVVDDERAAANRR